MGGKKVKGRKRHFAVDTQGNMLYIVVHAADISDRDGVWDVIDGIHERYPTITHIWVDGGYRGCEDDIYRSYGSTIDVVNKIPNQTTCIVLPRRWVVERTIAWTNRYRVLAKECTRDEIYSESFIYIASWDRLLKNIHPNADCQKPYENRKHDRNGVLLVT